MPTLRTLVAATCVALLPALSPANDLATLGERSAYRQTGRYDETVALCEAFAQRHPDAVRCETFGTTPEGRPMKLLVVSRSGALDPAAARAKQLPVVQFQAGIHAGEIDGKDAGFLALREVLDGDAARGALDKVVVLFVPVFNVDGHERFGRWNRPNQNGPEAMGWRTTAQNFNLNRDYVKVDAPEMQAMLALANRWEPILTVDLHVTDGAKFEHDMSVQTEPLYAGDAGLRTAGKALTADLLRTLTAQGSLPLAFYPSFVKSDDPMSGFADSVSAARFSTGYYWLRNRFGMLLETHSWKPYPVRVRITRNLIVDTLALAARDGASWLRAAGAADAAASELGGTPVALEYAPGDAVRTIAFRGYEYTRMPSEISGTLMTRYDDSKPQVWNVPMRDDMRPSLAIEAPRGGYVVPAAFADLVARKLDAHAIAYRRLDVAGRAVPLQTFRATKTTFAAAPLESHQTLVLEGEWREERRDVGAGALFVPIAQPKSRLLMTLLEPRARDSLAAWGFFNQAFEQKEYMEAYVAEDVARVQLAADPALREEFARKLDADAAFAADPNARLDFFYRRHSAYDERLNLYPVMRSERVLD
ncbi:M14 family zinc carboxypeptidase [Chiayiivirga flava]|uniref:Peptidase M14 domain-containing protein n=1 Tax=Chiayiivirga flava TaxID=659595 RepID=A0A7W8D875_9GAMM|nr:hypothetical protein [Chiayiivirga flava]